MKKWLNRFRRKVAKSIEPKKAWSRATHYAYPEHHSDVEGVWTVNFYAYDPIAWMFRGEEHATKPEFPEPLAPHPNNWPQVGEKDGKPIYGVAPGVRSGTAEELALSIEAWDEYYRNCPQPLTLLDTTSGKAADRQTAYQEASAEVQRRIDSYRR